MPQNPILSIKAPTLRSVCCKPGLGLCISKRNENRQKPPARPREFKLFKSSNNKPCYTAMCTFSVHVQKYDNDRRKRCSALYHHTAMCRRHKLISRSLEQLSFFVQNMGNFLQSTALLQAVGGF